MKILTNSQIQSHSKIEIVNCYSITNVGYQYISGIENLQYINLSSRSVTDEVIRSIEKLIFLKHLKLEGCTNITDIAMKYISRLPFLLILNVCSCNLTLSGFSFISKLKSLQLPFTTHKKYKHA